MGTQEFNCESLRKRVDALEAQNRRYMKAGIVVLIVAACAVFMAQTTAKRTVEAEEFVLHDASGRVRAKLFMLGDVFPSLALMDKKGVTRATLTAGPQGPGLALTDASGRPRVAVSDDPTEGPGLLLMDSSGNVRMQLTAPNDAGLQFREANGKVRPELQLSDKGPLYRLNDANEQPRLTLGVSEKGPGLFLVDGTGKPQAVLAGTQKGPWLVLYDAQGREVFSKP